MCCKLRRTGSEPLLLKSVVSNFHSGPGSHLVQRQLSDGLEPQGRSKFSILQVHVADSQVGQGRAGGQRSRASRRQGVAVKVKGLELGQRPQEVGVAALDAVILVVVGVRLESAGVTVRQRSTHTTWPVEEGGMALACFHRRRIEQTHSRDEMSKMMLDRHNIQLQAGYKLTAQHQLRNCYDHVGFDGSDGNHPGKLDN